MKAVHEGEPGRERMADERFVLRIVVRTPSGKLGERHATIKNWLDKNCGIDSWWLAPTGTRGANNDAIAIYIDNPTSALAFIACWCRPDSPPGLYEFRETGGSNQLESPACYPTGEALV